ncbi:MAG: hypothetical protein AB7I68_15335 [Porticoccaceae bacterium]
MQRAVAVQVTKFAAATALLGGLFGGWLLAEDQAIRGASLAFALILGLPVFLLVLVDTGSLLRRLEGESPVYRRFGQVLGFPQAIFGLTCAFTGIALVPLVLYKWFFRDQPPTGHWVAGALGFIGFGLFIFKFAFKAPPPPESEIAQGDDA